MFLIIIMRIYILFWGQIGRNVTIFRFNGDRNHPKQILVIKTEKFKKERLLQ